MIYHYLLLEGKITKSEIEFYLNLDNRITIYNYILEIKAFLGELALITNEPMTVRYDYENKEFYLEEDTR